MLDIGVFGIIFPHVSSVEEAWNAVGACRYPRLSTAPLYNPPGIRGDAPARAARYWGLTQQEYYKRADVWPLAPDGEILVVIQCEETRAIDNLPKILKEVPGIGVVLDRRRRFEPGVGPSARLRSSGRRQGDQLAFSRSAKSTTFPAAIPIPTRKNIERLVASGYRFLMPSAPRSFGVLDQGRKLAGRN